MFLDLPPFAVGDPPPTRCRLTTRNIHLVPTNLLSELAGMSARSVADGVERAPGQDAKRCAMVCQDRHPGARAVGEADKQASRSAGTERNQRSATGGRPGTSTGNCADWWHTP
jgi:hypothetical protein